MAKRLIPGAREYNARLISVANDLNQFFGFDNPGPSPLDYPDKIQDIFQKHEIHTVSLRGRNRAVSGISKYSFLTLVMGLVDNFRINYALVREQILEEECFRAEEQGKRGIEDSRYRSLFNS